MLWPQLLVSMKTAKIHSHFSGDEAKQEASIVIEGVVNYDRYLAINGKDMNISHMTLRILEGIKKEHEDSLVKRHSTMIERKECSVFGEFIFSPSYEYEGVVYQDSFYAYLYVGTDTFSRILDRVNHRVFPHEMHLIVSGDTLNNEVTNALSWDSSKKKELVIIDYGIHYNHYDANQKENPPDSF